MHNVFRCITICFISLLLSNSCNKPSNAFIDNKSVTINLDFDNSEMPIIQSIKWNNKNTVIKNIVSTDATANWIKQLTGAKGKVLSNGWNISSDSIYYKATAGFSIKPFYIELNVKLLKQSSYICYYYTIKNESNTAQKVIQFPIFFGSFKISDEKNMLKWWEALTYTPISDTITTSTNIALHSRIHSSDSYKGVRGNLPFWQIRNSQGNIFFALAWCGGWQANFTCNEGNNLIMNVSLPEPETQLTLQPNESISGPKLFISPIAEPNEMLARSQWFAIWQNLANASYNASAVHFPLIYSQCIENDTLPLAEYVRNQLKAMNNYGFDAYVFDGGYETHPNTFTKQELKRVATQLKISNLKVGLASSPQFKENSVNTPFIDYASSNFIDLLENHIDTLTQNIKANWWTFSNAFFAHETYSGKMKNVIAMQLAFESVRKLHPNIVFESNVEGGKMINVFIDELTQFHRVNNEKQIGYIQSISNINEALGATEILEPHKVERFTNRLNEIDVTNPEIMKLYCRSCMLGTWGISADLTKINVEQKAIMINEISNYKKLNELKKFELFEHNKPNYNTYNAYAAYYNADFTKVGILFYRMYFGNGKMELKIPLALNAERIYRITNTDSEIIAELTGAILNNGFSLILDNKQLSTIYFIEAID